MIPSTKAYEEKRGSKFILCIRRYNEINLIPKVFVRLEEFSNYQNLRDEKQLDYNIIGYNITSYNITTILNENHSNVIGCIRNVMDCYMYKKSKFQYIVTDDDITQVDIYEGKYSSNLEIPVKVIDTIKQMANNLVTGDTNKKMADNLVTGDTNEIATLVRRSATGINPHGLRPEDKIDEYKDSDTLKKEGILSFTRDAIKSDSKFLKMLHNKFTNMTTNGHFMYGAIPARSFMSIPRREVNPSSFPPVQWVMKNLAVFNDINKLPAYLPVKVGSDYQYSITAKRILNDNEKVKSLVDIVRHSGGADDSTTTRTPENALMTYIKDAEVIQKCIGVFKTVFVKNKSNYFMAKNLGKSVEKITLAEFLPHIHMMNEVLYIDQTRRRSLRPKKQRMKPKNKTKE